MADWFKAFVAGQQKLASSFVIVFLTLALSFAGAVFDSPVNRVAPAQAAGQVCATGWTLITTAGTYKNYCSNNVVNASEMFTVPEGINTVVINGYGGGGGAGGSAIDSCCGNSGYGAGGGAGGKLTANLTVTAGQVLGFYPGKNGTAGLNNSATNAAGGVSLSLIHISEPTRRS